MKTTKYTEQQVAHLIAQLRAERDHWRGLAVEAFGMKGANNTCDVCDCPVCTDHD